MEKKDPEFTLTDIIECPECKMLVSPSQVNSDRAILYSDDRKRIIGFECYDCEEWIAFPKTFISPLIK